MTMAKKVPVSLGHGMLLPKNIQHNAGIVNFMCVNRTQQPSVESFFSEGPWVLFVL